MQQNKEVPKTQAEKFKALEETNPILRKLAETFDLVIEL